LRLEVRPAADEAARGGLLREVLGGGKGAAIVYTATIRAVDEVAAQLVQTGFKTGRYHGRMAAKRRAATQDDFMANKIQTLVATNAFGLGIDKPDLRLVVHYNLPGTLDSFYQEFGRAGRDNQPARGILLYRPADRKLQRFFLGGRFPTDGDLVNAYHAVECCCTGGNEPGLEELTAAAPLRPARLKTCLSLLINRGAIDQSRSRGYRLRQQLTRDQVARLVDGYRERHERDLVRQQRMIDYAEGSTCRWRTILDYFDDATLANEGCGNCDRCAATAHWRHP
jgi:ATP-dependent DNA helicase RecQ